MRSEIRNMLPPCSIFNREVQAQNLEVSQLYHKFTKKKPTKFLSKLLEIWKFHNYTTNLQKSLLNFYQSLHKFPAILKFDQYNTNLPKKKSYQIDM